MEHVEAYRRYEIVDSGVGHYLIIKQGEHDYEQEPFATIADAKKGIDERVERA